LSELSNSDEWETPKDLFDYLCDRYELYPTLDVCATLKNTKCLGYLPKPIGLSKASWKPNPMVDTVWCNPPHSQTEAFVRKARFEWKWANINILMIIPANSMCTNYSEECIRPTEADWYPINRKWCHFLFKGEVVGSSRNGYFVVIWRKRDEAQ